MARNPPEALRKRRILKKDDIPKRDWSKNPLGEAFTKLPEATETLRFYNTQDQVGGRELYEQHKILEGKIRQFIKARPIRDMGIAILKGKKHGFYYVRISSNQKDSKIFIRIDKPNFIKAVRFLEEKGKA